MFTHGKDFGYREYVSVSMCYGICPYFDVVNHNSIRVQISKGHLKLAECELRLQEEKDLKERLWQLENNMEDQELEQLIKPLRIAVKEQVIRGLQVWS